MGYARERLISNNLWDSFVARLGEARNKGTISDEDIGIILAADETEKLLKSNDNDTVIVNKIVNTDYVNKVRAEAEKLSQKSARNAQKVQDLNNKIVEVQKIASISEVNLNAVEKRIKSISKIASQVIVILLGLLLIGIIIVIFILIARITNIQWIATYSPLITGAIILSVSIILGKDISSPTGSIISLRAKANKFTEQNTYRLVAKLFSFNKERDSLADKSESLD